MNESGYKCTKKFGYRKRCKAKKRIVTDHPPTPPSNTFRLLSVKEPLEFLTANRALSADQEFAQKSPVGIFNR
jgi:hypothetical protein